RDGLRHRLRRFFDAVLEFLVAEKRLAEGDRTREHVGNDRFHAEDRKLAVCRCPACFLVFGGAALPALFEALRGVRYRYFARSSIAERDAHRRTVRVAVAGGIEAVMLAVAVSDAGEAAACENFAVRIEYLDARYLARKCARKQHRQLAVGIGARLPQEHI